MAARARTTALIVSGCESLGVRLLEALASLASASFAVILVNRTSKLTRGHRRVLCRDQPLIEPTDYATFYEWANAQIEGGAPRQTVAPSTPLPPRFPGRFARRRPVLHRNESPSAHGGRVRPGPPSYLQSFLSPLVASAAVLTLQGRLTPAQLVDLDTGQLRDDCGSLELDDGAIVNFDAGDAGLIRAHVLSTQHRGDLGGPLLRNPSGQRMRPSRVQSILHGAAVETGLPLTHVWSPPLDQRHASTGWLILSRRCSRVDPTWEWGNRRCRATTRGPVAGSRGSRRSRCGVSP